MEQPAHFEPKLFDDANMAFGRLLEIYEHNTEFLRLRFADVLKGRRGRFRACYPYLRLDVSHFGQRHSKLAYGFVDEPGLYQTTITQPRLFERYLKNQIAHLLKNHQVPVEVGVSDSPIALHFSFPEKFHLEEDLSSDIRPMLRDMFDMPDLSVMDDRIADGTYDYISATHRPLSLFTAPRIDYSVFRLYHYTATSARHFQNFILLTNYQFYVDEFARLAQELMEDKNSDYTAFIEPGDCLTPNIGTMMAPDGQPAQRLPQMPAYHLKAKDDNGITLINIGVGPSNAKTITDHVAVLRPHAWVMLGHCAGLRNTQRLGDYVLAHAYLREDHVLDANLPTWVPVPSLAEIQVALEQSVADETGLSGHELKRIMRTGTVASVDNRNWELDSQNVMVSRFSQSRAIALDMESATIAGNGFRFRVPYGTFLCVSDKPLHGELKLSGMATSFYKQQVAQHLRIGIRAMESLRALSHEKLHSRKLRSFAEVAFQ